MKSNDPPQNPPPGYPTVCPYLVVEGARELMDFAKEVFGAEVRICMEAPGDLIGHAELVLGESMIMVADACEHARPNTTMLHIYVPDVDATYQLALKAGATSEREPTDQFYGDRSGGVKDRFGNTWHMATHVEDVSEEELKRRHQEMVEKQG